MCVSNPGFEPYVDYALVADGTDSEILLPTVLGVGNVYGVDERVLSKNSKIVPASHVPGSACSD